MTKSVGMIGLGIMGGAMARNMKAGGIDVIGFDLDPAACATASASGVTIVGSAEAVAEQVGDIIVCLPSPKAVLATAKAIAAGKAKSRTVVECSTLALEDKTAFQKILTEAGHEALDCPL